MRIRQSLLAALSLACALAIPVATPIEARGNVLGTDVICGTAEEKSSVATADKPNITCAAAIVVGENGVTYFERDADKELKIASITKVMTAIVALENASLDDTITVDKAAATVGQSSADFQLGDTMDLKTALKGLMIPSGNDAAMAIATCVGKKIDPSSDDPYQTFIDEMNKTAESLGMSHSKFTNPHGLDFDGWEGELHSSARDVAKMFAYAMTIKEFRELEADEDTSITVTQKDGQKRTYELSRTSKIFGKDGNIAGKTGSTYEALNCYVGAFKRDEGGEVYTVTLGSKESDERWDATTTLANWYYGHTKELPALVSDHTTADGGVLAGAVAHTDWTNLTVPVTIEDTDTKVCYFDLAGDITESLELKPVSGQVKRGQKVGALVVRQKDEVMATVNLVAAVDQGEPNFLEGILVQADRLWRQLTGQPTQAETESYLKPLV